MHSRNTACGLGWRLYILWKWLLLDATLRLDDSNLEQTLIVHWVNLGLTWTWRAATNLVDSIHMLVTSFDSVRTSEALAGARPSKMSKLLETDSPDPQPRDIILLLGTVTKVQRSSGFILATCSFAIRECS